MNKNQILNELKSISLPELTVVAKGMGDSSWEYALLLLAALRTGTNARSIQSFTQLDESLVERAVANLVNGGVFIGEEIDQVWFDEDNGIAFMLDCQIAEGDLVRVSADSVERNYTLTEQGKNKAEHILRGMIKQKDN